MDSIELEAVIGRGGMGVVWKGYHTALERPVAIKVDLNQRASSERALFDELRLMAGLSHKNIVGLIDHGRIEVGQPDLPAGARYLVLELCEGLDLGQRPPQDWTELKHVLEGVLEGLAYAHARGVVHRDLKPGNVLFEERTESVLQTRVKLTDFGIAARRETGIGMSQAGAGTPRYMAPEQFHQDWRSQGPSTDLYALGTMAWMLAVGEHPYPNTTYFQLMNAHLNREPGVFRPILPVPVDFEAWIRSLLKKDPQARPGFAARALTALRALGEPVGTERRPRMRLDSQRTRRGPPLNLATGTADRAAAASQRSTSLNLWGLRPIPMVDRVEERALLWASLDEVIRLGTAQAVVLEGPPGTGKSKLLEWLAERAHQQGMADRIRAVHSRGRDEAHGLVPMLANTLVTEGLDEEGLETRLTGLFGAGPLVSEVTELLERPLSFDRRSRLVAVERVLRDRAARAPVLLVLEDVQFGAEAIALTQLLLESQDERPVPILIVLTVRDTDLVERPEEAEALRLLVTRERVRQASVRPLSPKDHRELVHSLLGFSDAFAEQVAVRTEGNPLFAVQLVSHWVETSVLVPAPQGLKLAEGRKLEIPADLVSVWHARLERVLRTQGEQKAMEIAAGMGLSVVEAGWRRACAASGVAIEAGLIERWAQQRLLRLDPREPGVFTFSHGLLREALVDRAKHHGRWIALNQVIVDSLRGTDVDAERMARHCLEAADEDEALTYLLDAVMQQLRGSEFTSERLLDEATALITHLSLPSDDPRHGQLRLSRAGLLLGRRDLVEAKATAEALQELADEHGWEELQAKALRLRGKIELQLGKHTEAIRLLLEAEQHFDDLGLIPQCLDCWVAMGDCSRSQGHLDEAEASYQHALSMVEDTMLPRFATQPHIGLTLLWLVRKDIDRGLRQLELGEPLAQPWMFGERARFANLRGELYRLAGRSREAAAAYREAAALWSDLGTPDVVYPLLNGAVLEVEAERWDIALENCERLQRRVRNKVLEMYTRSVMVPCLAALGRDAAMLEHVRWMHAYLAASTLADGDVLRLLERTVKVLAHRSLPAPPELLAMIQMQRDRGA